MDATATTMVPIGAVDIGDRMRAVDGRQVAALAESIAAVGLINPIIVCPLRPIDEGAPGPRWILVAGAHRLQACRDLGWASITAVVAEMDEPHRQLMECDENLCGPRLTLAERAMLTRRRKQAYEAIHPETRHGATGNGRKKSRHNGEASRFSADTAARTGKSERAVQRDAKRGRIDPKVLEEIRGTCLDEGKALDLLAATPLAEQMAKVLQLQEARSLAEQKRTRRADGTADETAEGPQPPGSTAAWLYQTIGHTDAMCLAERLAREHLPDFLAELRSLTGLGKPVGASQPISPRQDNARTQPGSEEACVVSVTSEAAADPMLDAVRTVQAETVNESAIQIEPAIEPAGHSVLMADLARQAEAPGPVVGDFTLPPNGGERRQTLLLSSNWRDMNVDPKPGACCRECKGTTWWGAPASGWRCGGCFDRPTPRPTGYVERSTGP